MSDDDIHRLDKILWQASFDEKCMTFEMLGYEANVNVSVQTLRRTLHHLDWFKCIACRKGWVNPSHAERRIKWAEEALFLRPEPEDWDNVRFSDEMHAGFGTQGKAWIFRKPGTRTCPDCIQHVAPESKEEKDKKRKHVWAAVGYEFKSPLIFYKVPGNRNGKMTHRVYIDSILEPVVKPWILDVRLGRCDPFTLEEDGDSGHGTGKRNIVVDWKRENDLDCYFNCSGSPDLAPIENTWQGPKQWMKTVPHWDDETTENLLVEGWDDHMPQSFINERCREMPQRLRDVITAKGQMTGY